MSPKPANRTQDQNLYEELTEDPVTFFGFIVLALLILPGLIPGVRDTAVTWLLAHHVVVPAAEASLTIPYTAAGLDARRIVIAVFAALVLGALLVLWQRSRSRALQRARQRAELGRRS